jgi:O-acetyl-ADP-ribose deacetylase (regulator of RNase III)
VIMEYGFKDIFESGARCIVNTVNCHAHHLKPGRQMGLAKAFEERFPDIQPRFKDACSKGLMKPGSVLIFRIDSKTGKRSAEGDLFIANVATKDHWRDKSKISWVRTGVQKLAMAVEKKRIPSIAIPQMGAGLGGLPWKDVQLEVHEAFEPLSRRGVQVMVLGEDELGLFGKESKSFSYAGIGARDTPPAALKKMEDVAEIMAARGGLLRSGAADGADTAFENGADRVYGDKEIYLPWPGFNGRKPDGKSVFCEITDKHLEMASKYHPYWEKLGSPARNLMARNASQCLGRGLDDASGVIICYTQRGLAKRGTGQSIRMANDLKIPVINLGADLWKSVDAEVIAALAVRVARKESTIEDVEFEAKQARSYVTGNDMTR